MPQAQAGAQVTSTAQIVDNIILNADISSSAAIALSKLATGALPSGITVANANVTAAAAIVGTKLADNAIGKDQLGILTTKGDLLTYSTEPIRVGIGTNDQVLIADSAQAAGYKWGAAGGGIWTLQEQKIITVGVTTTDFASLPAKTMWMLIGRVENSHSGNITVTMEFNGDTTTTNYYRTWINNTTLTEDNSPPTIARAIDNADSNTVMVFFEGEPTADQLSIITPTIDSDDAGASIRIGLRGLWKNASGAVTSLLLRSDVASVLKGKFELYYLDIA